MINKITYKQAMEVLHDCLTIQETEKKFGVSERTIWRWINEGKIEAYQFKKGKGNFFTVIDPECVPVFKRKYNRYIDKTTEK